MSFARTIVLAAAAAAVAAPAGAQGSGWTTIGRGATEPDSDSGTIAVRWDPDFREAMLCVEGHAIRVAEATLRFEDGSSKVVKLRQLLADGACSKPLAVPRKAKVASVDIGYDGESLAGAGAELQIAAR